MPGFLAGPKPTLGGQSPTRYPKDWTPASVVQTSFAAGHGYFASGTGATVADDTSAFVMGSQCLKLTTGGNGVAAFAKKNSFTAVDLTGKQVRVWVRLPTPADIANLASLNLYIGNDTAMTNSYGGTFASGFAGEILGKEDGWYGFVVNIGDLIAAGTPVRTAITCLWLRAVDANSQVVNVQFGGVEFIPEPANGVVSFTFDDGRTTQYTEGRKKLSQYRYPATAYVIRSVVQGEADNLDGSFSPSTMTLAQLKELQEYHGWDIACHANTIAAHNSTNGLTDLTAAAVEDEFGQQQKWLIDNGFVGGQHLAYPKGLHNQTVYDAAKRHFKSARSVYGFPKCTTYPPTAPIKLRSFTVAGDTTFAAIQTEITRARVNKEWLILVFHDLVTTPSPSNSTTQFPIATFGQVVDECATQGVAVRTVADVVERGIA